jgi:hypothetical protein
VLERLEAMDIQQQQRRHVAVAVVAVLERL